MVAALQTEGQTGALFAYFPLERRNEAEEAELFYSKNVVMGNRSDLTLLVRSAKMKVMKRNRSPSCLLPIKDRVLVPSVHLLRYRNVFHIS